MIFSTIINNKTITIFYLIDDFVQQLLFDFIPEFKKRLLALNNFSEIGDLVSQLIINRHIQAYSRDHDIQALAERFNLDGRMIASAPKTDYLSVVSTSIGGNKSDHFVHTDLHHQSLISRNGSITNNLMITKNHTWQIQDYYKWVRLVWIYGTGPLNLETLRFILGEGDNVDYMRVYVPRGSRLIDTAGIDIQKITTSEDLDYTVFAFTFTPVSAGNSQTVHLQYKLPYTLAFSPSDNYRFITQKQAGAENINLKKSLVTADLLEVAKSYPDLNKTSAIEIPLNQNEIFLAAISTKE